ncbi:MAG TPA: hypothetical protein PKE69_13850 [Pyrinomonadaceae bacterium]|nr:hypothetical protein [Pyrinomonadaceae bacterium]
MKLKSVCLILLFSLVVNSVFSQKDWEKKSYESWNKDNVTELLSNSPWVKTVNYQEVLNTSQQLGTVISPTTSARMVLRSALPIRQALLRQRQLDVKYDKMSDDDKKKFDAKNAALLNCPACKDYYVVSVYYRYLAMDNKNYVMDKKNMFISPMTKEIKENSSNFRFCPTEIMK